MNVIWWILTQCGRVFCLSLLPHGVQINSWHLKHLAYSVGLMQMGFSCLARWPRRHWRHFWWFGWSILGSHWVPGSDGQVGPRGLSFSKLQVIVIASWAPDCKLALEMLGGDHKLDIWGLLEKRMPFLFPSGEDVNRSINSITFRREHGLGSFKKVNP